MDKVSNQKSLGRIAEVERAPDCHMCRMLQMYSDEPVCTRCGANLNL